MSIFPSNNGVLCDNQDYILGIFSTGGVKIPINTSVNIFSISELEVYIDTNKNYFYVYSNNDIMITVNDKSTNIISNLLITSCDMISIHVKKFILIYSNYISMFSKNNILLKLDN